MVPLVVVTWVVASLLRTRSRLSILVILGGILILMLWWTPQPILPMSMNRLFPQWSPLPNSWTCIPPPLVTAYLLLARSSGGGTVGCIPNVYYASSY